MRIQAKSTAPVTSISLAASPAAHVGAQGTLAQVIQSNAFPDRLTLAAFAVYIALTGAGPLLARLTFQNFAPFWGGFLRFGAAGLVFALISFIRRVQLPRGRALGATVLFGALNVGIAFIFVFWGLVKTPSSVYAVTIAIVPLLTLFFAAAHQLERFRFRSLVGGLLTIAGIVVAMSSSLAAGVELSLPHLAAILVAGVILAEAGVIGKLIPHSHPLAINTISMATGALVMLTASSIAQEPWSLPLNFGDWLPMIVLTIGGPIIGFGLYMYVLTHWTASGTSYSYVLAPVTTIILAAGLAGEKITLVFLLGGVFALLGVWVGVLSGQSAGSNARLGH